MPSAKRSQNFGTGRTNSLDTDLQSTETHDSADLRRFFAIFAIALVLFYAVYATATVMAWLDWILRATAFLTAASLATIGFDARADGPMVVAPEFVFLVVRGCSGIEPIGFLLSAAVATPVPRPRRILFALLGAMALVALNIFRLVTLAVIGIHHPQVSDFLHWKIWPVVTITAVAGMWVLWVYRMRVQTHVIEA